MNIISDSRIQSIHSKDINMQIELQTSPIAEALHEFCKCKWKQESVESENK